MQSRFKPKLPECEKPLPLNILLVNAASMQNIEELLNPTSAFPINILYTEMQNLHNPTGSSVFRKIVIGASQVGELKC
jgi:hypothetical protein